MAEFSSQIAPNFVLILWISQTGLDRGYSQLINTWVIFGFCLMISPLAETLDND
jgi:hypothetical protein